MCSKNTQNKKINLSFRAYKRILKNAINGTERDDARIAVRIHIETVFLRINHCSTKTVIYTRLIRINIFRTLCKDFNEAFRRIIVIGLCFTYSTYLTIKEFKIGDYCHFAFHL